MDSKLAEKILACVSEERIVSMACDVINIPSPTGEEGAMAAYMRRAMEELGLAVSWQEVEEGRPNVVGRWEGQGAGKSLMFNGHMDTSNTGREPHLTGIGYKPHTVVKDGLIYGLGIYNMKGALVCYLQAVRALQEAGVRLDGDVIVAAVVGEIEKSQWGDEFIGKEYRGYGVGSHYLVCHGVVPDMCILGEPTDMQLVLGHCGSLWARLSTRGPYMHTGFTMGRQGENSIRRMHDVLADVLKWIAAWEQKAAYGDKPGVVNLGSIRGGHPWRASRTPERTDLFLDVRVPPTMPLAQARRELAQLVRQLRERYPDYGLEFETFVSVPGAEISGDHEMVRAIEASHRQVLGEAPRRGTVVWCSDASVLTRFGIETVNYGPSSGPRDAEGEKVRIKTLVDVTKVYALTIAQICGAR
ncbi:MAG TPA: M20/M25/M40 family metallo-hydrolase [Candidatus Acidoferrales bacterium]|nr:M20/M25/M40 family metallo-hydrolase [Candidatus Acidoferrales bacterium]